MILQQSMPAKAATATVNRLLNVSADVAASQDSIRNFQAIKISLQFTVFSGCTMQTNKYSIEINFAIINGERKIILVDRNFFTVAIGIKPALQD